MKLLTLITLLVLILVLPSAALAATLSLSPASGTFNKGCSFTLEIKLDTVGAQTDGTDAIVLYDQGKFQATSISSGPIYSDYPGNNIDDVSGKITVSGLASVSSAFSGTGTLATINFTVRETAPTGATMIKLDFDGNDKTKTTDSNVVQRGTVLDILSSVTNGNYTVGTGACGVGVTPAPSVLPKTGQGAVSVSTPSAQEIPLKTLPPAGSEQLTFTLAIVGSVLTVLGILGLALL